LLVQPTVEAAAAVGVTPKTLASWMAQDDFKAACKQARQAVLERTVSRLVNATGQAVDVLLAELQGQRPSDRLRAAAIILQHAHKGLEASDLSEDLAELKKQVEEILHYGSTQASRRAAEWPGATATPVAGNGAARGGGGAGGTESHAPE
jgi:hypothetical protein